MFCIKCGQELPEVATYCFVCGTAQKALARVQSGDMEEPSNSLSTHHWETRRSDTGDTTAEAVEGHFRIIEIEVDNQSKVFTLDEITEHALGVKVSGLRHHPWFREQPNLVRRLETICTYVVHHFEVTRGASYKSQWHQAAIQMADLIVDVLIMFGKTKGLHLSQIDLNNEGWGNGDMKVPYPDHVFALLAPVEALFGEFGLVTKRHGRGNSGFQFSHSIRTSGRSQGNLNRHFIEWFAITYPAGAEYSLHVVRAFEFGHVTNQAITPR